MKTIKLFFIIPAMFICFASYSQISFDVNAGVNIGNLHSKVNGTKQDGLKAAVGYTIPLHINIPIAKSLFFQTGLEYESVQHKFHSSITYSEIGFVVVDNYSTKSRLDYINIPLKLFYKITPLFQLGFGPFAGIGISGRDKILETQYTTTMQGTREDIRDYKNKIKFGTKNPELKRFNLGLGIDLSYTFLQKIIIGLYSNLGLTNINNYDYVKARTLTGGLTIGYRMAKNVHK